jgi:DNA polymerase I-like protein with 3'-5' exonuclease and polymerase domains
MRHEGGDNVDVDQALRYFRAQAASFDGDVVGANIQYDLDYLANDDVNFSNVRYIRDVQVADPLIHELHQSYSLQNISQRYGLPGKDEQLLIEAASTYGVSPKAGMWKLPARFVGPYAEQDAVLPLALLRKQEKLIDERDLWDIYNLESEVTPVLVRMRRRGVRIDLDKLEEIENWTLIEEAEALAKVKTLTGINIDVGDVWKAAALAPALEFIGIKLEKTKTGKPSISKEVLDTVDHPVAEALAHARKINKLRTTFASSIRRYMVNGRIHCTFNQIARETERGGQQGARFGRLSAVDPNLQQQPSRDEFAAMWRSIYIPEEGALWACNDYSQQEPRWTTHFAAKMKLPGAAEAAQAYHDDPDLDNHQFMADLTGLPRKQAKDVYLGLCYGEGGAKLSRDLGLPTRWACRYGDRGTPLKMFETQTEAMAFKREQPGGAFVWEAAGEEGQDILDKFDERAPFIKKVAKAASDRAKSRGWVRTGGGRVLNFPELANGGYDWCHKALNRIIQGTSADQTKKAIVEIDKAGHHLMLQVHDETDSSVADVAEAKQIGDIMQDAMPALVPFKVDLEIGPSWGEIK